MKRREGVLGRRSLAGFGNVILVLCLFAHGQEGSLLPSDPIVDARRYYNNHQLERAEIILREFLLSNPSSADALYLLGHVLESANQPKKSLEIFNKAATIAKPSGEDLRIAALDYVLLGDYRSSQQWLGRSLELDSNNGEAWYDLARTKMMLGDYIGAEGAMRRALALKPKMVKAENNLGLILEAQNRTAEAAEAYRLAVEWQRSDPHPSEQPLLNYGTLLIDQQKSSEAIPLLEQAIAIAPKDVKGHEQLARALDRQGKQASAIEQMQAAILLDPRNPRLHYQLGRMYRRVGNDKRAKEEMAVSQSLYGTTASEP